MKRLRVAILGIFEEILTRKNISRGTGFTRHTKGIFPQFQSNLIPSTGGLRVQASNQYILVDVDRSGGIVHLMQCWKFLGRNRVEGTPHISLFYVFLSQSNRARENYLALWDFMWVKVHNDLGDCLQAHFATIERPLPLDLHVGIPDTIIEHCKAQLQEQCILGIFEQLLSGKPGPRNRPPSFTSHEEISSRDSRVKSNAGVPGQ